MSKRIRVWSCVLTLLAVLAPPAWACYQCESERCKSVSGAVGGHRTCNYGAICGVRGCAGYCTTYGPDCTAGGGGGGTGGACTPGGGCQQDPPGITLNGEPSEDWASPALLRAARLGLVACVR